MTICRINKQFLFFIIIQSVLLLCGKSVCAVPAFVSHVGFNFEDSNVIFYQGSEKGIKPGDIIEVIRDDNTVAILEAVEVNPFYTKAKILSEAEKDKSTEMLGEIRKIEEPEAEIPVVKKPDRIVSKSAPEQKTEKQVEKDTISKDQIMVKDEEMEKRIKRGKIDVDLHGYRYILFRKYDSSGSQQKFESNNGLLTRGNKVEQGTDIDIKASYGDKVVVEGSLYELPYQERKLRFDLGAGDYNATFGVFAPDFRTGKYAAINKETTGVHAQYTGDKLEADFLTSKSKSQSKTVSFTGDNTHGPFSLNSFQILEDSEIVKLNGHLLSSDKYYIDYFSGQITFCSESSSIECIDIGTSDEIQIEFEERNLLSLSSGGVSGMSAKYQFTDDLSIGFANVLREASRARDQVLAADTFETDGLLILASSNPSYISIDCSGSEYNDQYCFLDPTQGRLRIFKNDSIMDTDDYSIDPYGYLTGMIELLIPIQNDDVFTVEYNYYVDEYIEEIPEEKLYEEDGTEDGYYNLTKSLPRIIYPGSEQGRIFFCETENCVAPQSMEYGADKDYEIQYGQNRILIHNVNFRPQGLEEHIIVSYWGVPRLTSEDSDYDHTVNEIFGETKLWNFDISFNYSESESDISKTAIQVLDENIIQFTSNILCPSQTPAPAECVLSLEHPDIEELSDKIISSKSDIALSRGMDYDIDYASGTITLTGGIEFNAGDILYADYKYFPDIQEGLTKGQARNISVTTQIKNFDVNYSTERVDPDYSPLSGNNSLEILRQDIGLSGNINDDLSLEINSSRFDKSKDITKSTVDTNRQLETGIYYDHGKSSYEIGYSKISVVDNLESHKTDQDKIKKSLSVDFKDIIKPDFNIGFALEDLDFNDNLGKSNNTSNSVKQLDMEYRFGEKLDMEAAFKTNKIDSSGATLEPFSTETNTQNVVFNYQPAPLINIMADVDRQRKSDSRPDQGNSGKDSTTLSVVALEMGKFQSTSLSIVKQSYPGFASGGTNAETSSLNTTYMISPELLLSPSISKTKTSTQSSTSDSTRKTAELEYRHKLKPLEISIQRDWTDTSTHQETTSQSSANNQLSFDVKYTFKEKLGVIYSFDNRKTSSANSSSKSDTHTYQLDYEPSKKMDFRLSYSSDVDKTQTTISQRKLILESDIALSDIIHWRSKFTKSKYTDSVNLNNGYKGTYLESEFRAEF